MISVIMPAYNCELFVEEAIRSVLNQTYTDFELLIADDASTDGTKGVIDRIAQTDSRIKTFHNEKNQGYLRASNLLMEKCAGVFITFQDADDISDPTRFEKLLRAFDKDCDIYCVGSNSVSFHDDISSGRKSNFPLGYEDILVGYPEKVVMTGSALMVRKEVLDDVGFYHIFFDRIGSEDIYWYGNIIEQYKTINLEESLYFYRQNPYSVSRSNSIKNYNALISHEVCVRSYLSRQKNRKDIVAEGTEKEKIILCKRLLAEYFIKKGKNKEAYKFFFKVLPFISNLDYAFFRLFARQTIYNLFKV